MDVKSRSGTEVMANVCACWREELSFFHTHLSIRISSISHFSFASRLGYLLIFMPLKFIIEDVRALRLRLVTQPSARKSLEMHAEAQIRDAFIRRTAGKGNKKLHLDDYRCQHYRLPCGDLIARRTRYRCIYAGYAPRILF
jgi:hypothetical protein